MSSVNGGQRLTLREQYGQKTNLAWEEEQNPIFTLVSDDGEIWGFPFFALTAAKLAGPLLTLQWPGAIVEIKGPKTLEFYKQFSKHKATWIKADSEGILSVQVHVPTEQEPETPAE
jgi:hypothetical protein